MLLKCCVGCFNPAESDVTTNHESIFSTFDRAYVTAVATDAAIRHVIRRYEAIRLHQYWQDVLGAKSNQGEFIRAFEVNRPNGSPQAAYLGSEAIRALVKDNYVNGPDAVIGLRTIGGLERQREEILTILPSTKLEATPLLVHLGAALGPCFEQMLDSANDIDKFVNEIAEELRSGKAKPYFAFRYNELFAMLWAEGLIQYPLDVWEWSSRHKWIAFKDAIWVGSELAEFISKCASYIPSKRLSRSVGIIYTFLAASSIKCSSALAAPQIDDFSALMLTRLDAQKSKLSENRLFSLRSQLKSCAHGLRLFHNATFPARPILFVKPTPLPDCEAKGSGTFQWLIRAAPSLSAWAESLSCYVAQLKTATTNGQIGRLNSWLDYLLTLSHPPDNPLLVVRRDHIRDPSHPARKTFYATLLDLKVRKGTKSSTLRELRDFFDWFAGTLFEAGDPAYATFKNPIAITDSFGSDDRPRQSPRDALPGYVLDELKEVITEGDFSFARTLGYCNVHVVHNQTGQASIQFYPGYAICLYLMLEAPIRSHQSRWFDSGDLDEFIVDVNSGSRVRNPSVHAIPGRREAVLRTHSDALRSEAWFGLWVNTNKTQAFEREEHGYSIPFASDTAVSLIDKMTIWERTFLPPLTVPTKYYATNQESIVRKMIAQKGPQVAPLFRDPAIAGFEDPIKYAQLVKFYARALMEVQSRIKEKYGLDIRLAEKQADGTIKWLVDLHTLRISGITSMIENGVPLEVVSQFAAGHATVVMTLHYLKYSPAKLREYLRRAHDTARSDCDFVGSEVFFERLDEFAPFILTQGGAGSGPGWDALRERSGLFSIRADGICPGTSCASGGPVDSTRIKHGPVPGGSRCGLCRYWLTGPAHLLGQVAEVNNLAYRIRKCGIEIASLCDQKIACEDSGEKRKALALAVRIDNMRLSLGLDLDEWAARYRYAADSAKLMDQYIAAKGSAEDPRVPILAATTREDLHVTLESAHEFALLDQITQLNEFVSGSENREAFLEKNTILSKMMDANGIRPFLLGLSEQHAREAGNLLSSLILRQVDARQLDGVLDGKIPLQNFPILSNALQFLDRKAAGLDSLSWDDVLRSL